MNVIELTKDRRPELFELLRRCLGEKETQQRNEAFWSWKHEQSPFGETLTWLAEEEGQLTGLRAFLQWQFRCGDDSFRAVRAVDTATHPDHRRKGIFRKLTLGGLEGVRQAGFNFIYNTPNPSSMPGYLKMGWQHVERLPMYVKLLRPANFAAKVLAAKLGNKSAGINYPRNELFRSEPITFDAWLDQAADVEELIVQDSSLRGQCYQTLRSVSFLHWRYASHPYVCYFVEEIADDEGRAVLVYRTNQRFGLKEVMICDLLIDKRSPNQLKSLLRKLVARLDADYLIAHFGPTSAHLKLMKQNGFYRLPMQGMDLTVHLLLGDQDRSLLEPSSWSLCLGDLEIF